MQFPAEVFQYFTTEEAVIQLQFQAVYQCGPLMKGVKPACLFTVPSGQGRTMAGILGSCGIKAVVIDRESKNKRESIFCYREHELKEILAEQARAALLGELGYPEECGMEWKIAFLCKRLSEYNQGTGQFPHEVGVFLGYPPGDVKGYMEDVHRQASSGEYWKVYEKPLRSETLFSLYDRAKVLSVNEFLSGKKPCEIMKHYL